MDLITTLYWTAWLEIGRLHYFMEMGFPMESPDRSVGWVLAEISCQYLKPLHFPDRVAITVRVDRIGKSSMMVKQQIVRS